MRLAKTLTALSLAALLAMLPACSSSSSNRAASGGGAVSIASLAHMDGTSLQSGSSKNVNYTVEEIAYDSTIFSKANDKNAAMSNDDRLVLEKQGKAAAGIAAVTDFETLDPALKGLDDLGFDIADVTTGVTGAGNDAAAATLDAQAKAKTALQGLIDEFNGELDDAVTLLLTAGLDWDDANTPANGGTMIFTNTDYEMVIGGIIDNDSGNIVVSDAILELLGFSWDSTDEEWCQAMDTLSTEGINGLKDAVKIDGSNIDIAALVDDDLVTTATQVTERLVVGNQELQYSTFGYYKKETLTTVSDGTPDATAVSGVDVFYGDNGEAPISTTAANLAAGINDLDLVLDATFTGKAVAALTVGTGGGAVHNDLHGTATLNFTHTNATPAETLYLGFANWYDVEYTSTSAAAVKWQADTSAFKAGTQLNGTAAFNAANPISAGTASFTANYYTDSKDPNVMTHGEAVGKFSATGTAGTGSVEGFNLQGAFGGIMTERELTPKP
jgi:hypothetical protein